MASQAASNTMTEECAHHWVLPSPGGLTSTGHCKFCGAEKEFSNAVAKAGSCAPELARTSHRYVNRLTHGAPSALPHLSAVA